MKHYNCYSVQAPLAVVGYAMQRAKIWETIEAYVHIAQKKVGHLPTDKLKDAFINMLCGGQGLVEVNTRVRTDRGIQKAFGRSGCAEQSSISRCLTASSSENVQQMRQALQTIFRQHSRCYRHNYEQDLLCLDVDMTGLQAGRQAEGSTKGYFSHASGARGRQVGRVFASRANEVVVDQLYPGKIQLERSLQELVGAMETTLELDEAKRRRILLRVDGGGGREADINWSLERNYLLLVKVKNWQRTQKLLQRVSTWYTDAKDPQRKIGWVDPAYDFTRPTRQMGVQDTHANGEVYRYVLVTNLTDDLIAALNQVMLPTPVSPQQVLALLLNLYDLRSGGIETSIRNSKSGLGLNKRNKKSFVAQELLVLLAQLAYLVLSWFYDLYLQGLPRFAGYGWLRLVRDVFHIPGRLSFTPDHELLAIHLSRDHFLASDFCSAFRASHLFNDLSLILRKI